MKNRRFLSLTLLALLTLLPVQARDDHQQSYTFVHKNKTWTITADRIQRKGAQFHFMGNVKAASNRGDKIFADNAELCQTLGKEKLTLSPVKGRTIIKP